MNLLKTKLQKENAGLPTELEFSTIASRRYLHKTKNEKYKHRRLVKGAIGEEIVFEYLKTYGQKHWLIFRNIWLDYYGEFECDFVVFTGHKFYILEVKNYTGLFTFQDGISKRNGQKINGNCFQQARRAYTNIQSICNEVSPVIPVEGAVIFPNVNNHIHIVSEVNDVKVVPRTYLKLFIDEMIKDRKNHFGSRVHAEKTIHQLGKYEIVNSHFPDPYSKNQMKFARRGICCMKCHSFNLTIHKHYVSCNCGFKELCESAVLRSIYEYCVLTYGQNFTRQEISFFIDHQYSKNFILKVINKHFKKINSNKHTKYLNVLPAQFRLQNMIPEFTLGEI